MKRKRRTTARRLLALVGAALATIALAAAAAPGATRAGTGQIAETGWKVLSASGTVTVSITKPDPDALFQQLQAHVVGRWRTTTYPNDLTLTWPLQKIRPHVLPALSFTTLEKLKTSLSGDVKGVYGDPHPGASVPPTPFGCSHDYRQAPSGFLTLNAAQLYGGSLSGGTMAMGLYTTYPYTVFAACRAPNGVDVATLMSTERLDWNNATWKPIPISMLRNGRKGERITLRVGLTAPIDSSETSAPVGQVVSLATLHLEFKFAA
jgi:hypothetical protein